MGVLYTKVKVKIGTKNIKYYQELGYKIPTRMRKKEHGKDWAYCLGDTIWVNVSDLPPKSHYKLNAECDNCKKNMSITQICYTKHVENNTPILCSKCLHSGENNSSYNPNITQEEREKGRNYQEYKEFIKRVLARDNYICQCCYKTSNSNLEVHHLDGYDWCIEKRIDDTNGITLCHNCHRNFHNIYGLGNNTKEQFEEWYGKALCLLSYNEDILSAKKVYCFENKKIYMSTLICSKKLNIKNDSRIYDICNHKNGIYSINNYHFAWYDEIKDMNEKELEKYYLKHFRNPHFKQVICIQTGEIFESMTDAAKKYNVSRKSIKKCCEEKHYKHNVGFSEKGEALIWCYFEDYIMLTSVDKEQLLKQIIISNVGRKVIDLFTMKVYKNMQNIYNDNNLSDSDRINVRNKCISNSIINYSYQLRWMFYDEYLRMINL